MLGRVVWIENRCSNGSVSPDSTATAKSERESLPPASALQDASYEFVASAAVKAHAS